MEALVVAGVAGLALLAGSAAAGPPRPAASGDPVRKNPPPPAPGKSLQKKPAPPAAPAVAAWPLGVALGGLMERVEEAMRQAPAEVRPATIDAGGQILAAVDKARLSWETRLGQGVRGLDATTRGHLAELEASVGRLERAKAADVEEAERAAARLFETILLVRGQPQVASAHPRLVVRGLPEERTTLTVSGTFPAVREVGDRPFLFVGGVTLVPESISAFA